MDKLPLVDEVKVFERYKKAADQGHAPAQFNLGVMYSNGEGVTKSYTKALKNR